MSSSAIPAEANASTFCPRQQRRYVLIAAILASSMGFIDGSVVAIAIPAIREGLPATLGEALWINNAYMLFLSSLILIGGAAGDRFGLRRTFVAGIGVFVVASIVCAIAPDANVLIVARALQGIGAALMVPGSLAIIAKAYPADERGKAIGTWAAASALTTAIGPVLGGLALSALGDIGWRLIFAVNLPLGAIALYLLLFRVPPDEPGEKEPLDWIGGVMITVALAALAYGLTGSGGEGSLPEGPTIAFGVTAFAVLTAAFIWWQRRTAHPMVPLRLFASRAFSGANILTFSLYFGLSGMLFYLPMTLIGGWGLSEAITAVLFVPLSAAIALFSSRAGDAADKYGAAPLVMIGSFIVAFAYAAIILVLPYRLFWTGIFPLMTLSAIGMSLVVSPLSAAVMGSVEDADTGKASGINNAVSRMSGLVAVATIGFLASAAYGMFTAGHPALADAAFAEALGDAGEEARAIHADATTRTFMLIAAVNAFLSFVSGVVAWKTLEWKR